MHELPALSEARPAAAQAADHIYGFVEIPDTLRAYLTELTTKDCQKGSFNEVALLAYDAAAHQAALQVNSCKGGSTLQYRIRAAGNYRLALESIGMPSCGDVADNGLSKVVAPICRSF